MENCPVRWGWVSSRIKRSKRIFLSPKYARRSFGLYRLSGLQCSYDGIGMERNRACLRFDVFAKVLKFSPTYWRFGQIPFHPRLYSYRANIRSSGVHCRAFTSVDCSTARWRQRPNFVGTNCIGLHNFNNSVRALVGVFGCTSGARPELASCHFRRLG